jgi:transposase InsO family protein
MVAKVLRQWLSGLGTKSLYIEPGSPWENGYCESFNGKLIGPQRVVQSEC